MTQTDVFAFQKSALASFLFAEVGTEANGSQLTVLSVLARLGQDPWEQAGQWVRLPKTTIIDRLTASIAQMPLSEQARLDARKTATRLIQLLPTHTSQSDGSKAVAAGRRRLTGWTPVYLVAVLLAIAIAVSQMMGDGANVGKVAPSVPAALAPAGQVIVK